MPYEPVRWPTDRVRHICKACGLNSAAYIHGDNTSTTGPTGIVEHCEACRAGGYEFIGHEGETGTVIHRAYTHLRDHILEEMKVRTYRR